MEKEFLRAYHRFFNHFRYYPNYPPDIDFDQMTYAEELDKCVEDDIDYTIEKYGTKPEPYGNNGLPEIIVD